MRRHVKTVHADFKDNATTDDRKNPGIIDEDDVIDKADDDEPNIRNKAETDDSDIDVGEEGGGRRRRRKRRRIKKRIQMTRGVYW